MNFPYGKTGIKPMTIRSINKCIVNGNNRIDHKKKAPHEGHFSFSSLFGYQDWM